MEISCGHQSGNIARCELIVIRRRVRGAGDFAADD